MTPRLLLIDNYDSFTYNLVQAFLILGAEVDVHRNDAITVEAALAGDDLLLIDLLYGDQDGGQRTISRFSIAQYSGADHEHVWLPAVVSHWYLDREGPR